MLTRECPACGSADLETKEDRREIRVPFGAPVDILQTVDMCRTCGESGDFSGVNDARIDQALVASIKGSVPRMLELLTGQGISMAYVERALDLPARTAARWKSGEHSAAAIALLRLLATYPWILNVAEHGFDPNVANRCVIIAAGNTLQQIASANDIDWRAHVNSTGSSATVNLRLSKQATDEQPEKLNAPQVSFIRQGS